MILAAALALLALAAGVGRWRGLRWLACGAVLALGGVLLAGEGWVARALLAPLQGPYLREPGIVWQDRNIIILLGAGTVRVPVEPAQPLRPGLFAYARLVRSMALYRECRASGHQCQLLVSGGDPLRNGESEAQAYGRSLRQLGLPAADLLIEGRSHNTRQNAALTSDILHRLPPAQLVLVSSAYHLRRASACFQAHRWAIVAVAADVLEPGEGALPSAYNLALSDQALHEWGGLLRDRLLIWSGQAL